LTYNFNCHVRFINRVYQQINEEGVPYVENEFVVKLNHSSGSHHGNYVKFATGLDGIKDKLMEFTRNEKVFGYIRTVIVQACIPRNTQASIVCLDGKAMLRNPNKKGRDHTSPFDRAPTQVFFDFAEHAIRQLREVCPHLIADQVLRVDFHGMHVKGKLTFYVNVIEGFETRVWGTGKASGVGLHKVDEFRRNYWYNVLDTLVETHLERVNNNN
jgi:hypothetical protein